MSKKPLLYSYMIGRKFVFGAVLGAFSLAVLLVPTQVSAAAYTVSITATQYVPSTLKISAGDTVNFLNTTSATQSAKTSVASGFNTGNIGPGQSKAVILSNAGTYSYTSQYNSALTGSIEVVASTTTTASSSATTAQPAKTQAQPVSGTTEVLLAMTLIGLGVMMFGGAWNRKMAQEEMEVELTDVSPLTFRNQNQ